MSGWKLGRDDAAQVPRVFRRRSRPADPHVPTRSDGRDVPTRGDGRDGRLRPLPGGHRRGGAARTAPLRAHRTANRLGRARLPAACWLATIQQIGLVSALMLSIITDGCCLDWDPAKGPAPPVLLPNLPSARAEAAYIS